MVVQTAGVWCAADAKTPPERAFLRAIEHRGHSRTKQHAPLAGLSGGQQTVKVLPVVNHRYANA